MREAILCLGYKHLIFSDLLGKRRPRRNRSVAPLQATVGNDLGASGEIADDMSLSTKGSAKYSTAGSAKSGMISEPSMTSPPIVLQDDEIANKETVKSKFLRAARFALMQEELDYAMPSEESHDILQMAYDGEYRIFSNNQLLLSLNKLYSKNKIMWWTIVFPVWLLDWFQGRVLKFSLKYGHFMTNDIYSSGTVVHHGILNAQQINTTNADGFIVNRKWKSPLTERYVQDMRLFSEKMKNSLSKLPNSVMQENYIMKSFLLSNLPTVFHRNLTERYFYASVEDNEAQGDNKDPLYGTGNTTVKTVDFHSNKGFPYFYEKQ